jgi:tRNA(Arg) A34 adenosine deaminase TadA
MACHSGKPGIRYAAQAVVEDTAGAREVASMSSLTPTDENYLRIAIDLSRHALEDEGKTPFGAILVINDEVVSEGTSSVIELVDPSAHAEIMALRNAARKLGRHVLTDSVLYSSSEPCPMCLTACYWARVSRLVFGATSYDVATHGFEDLQLYRELATEAGLRSLPEVSAGGTLRTQAADVLRNWAEDFPERVTPKY